MRRHDVDEFSRCDHPGFLPELRKMPRTAGHQVIGAGGIGAFQEIVVVRVLRHPQRAGWGNRARAVPDELEELLPYAFADLEVRT